MIGTKEEILLRVKLVDAKADQALAFLSSIDKRLETLMALADDLKKSIADLDAETTAIGTLITSLAGRIKNTMTDQEVTDIKAALTAEGARLTTLAVDPTNPVPPAPPQLQAARAKAKP